MDGKSPRYRRRMGLWVLLTGLGLMASSASAQFGPGAGPGGGAGGNFGPSNSLQQQIKKREVVAKKSHSLVNKGHTSFTIAAVVDNEVILLEDIIAQIKPRLEAAKRQLPASKYQEFERAQIESATKGRIQQVIMLQELRKRFPDGQLPLRLVSALEADFEKYMNKIALQNNLKSVEELVAKLKAEGADVAALKQSFMDQVMATQYMNSLIQPKLREPTRQEMEAYYQSHLDEFTEKAGAVWRQIEIRKGIDEAGARARIEQLLARLSAGENFEDVAKSDSEGPTAQAGGLWSRVSKGSYADPAVDDAIFSLPVGQISSVIDGKTSYHIIRVEERSDGLPTPMVDVQVPLRNRLRAGQIERLRQELLDSIESSHHVVTAFDSDGPERQIARPDSAQEFR